MTFGLSMTSYVRESRRALNGPASSEGPRRWRVFENDRGETLFELFLAKADELEAAVRTVVWAGPPLSEVVLAFVNGCFRAACGEDGFDFVDPPPGFATEAILKWRTPDSGTTQYVTSIDSPEKADDFQFKVSRIAPASIVFYRFDVLDQSQRGIALTIQEPDSPNRWGYTVSAHWPLKFSKRLMHWIVEHHWDANLRDSKAGLRVVESVLNSEP